MTRAAPARRPRVAIIGSSNTDMIVEVSRLPAPGETILGGHFRTAGGGKGANQAIGAARAGGHVTFVARVGRDTLGDSALAALRREGVDVTRVTRDAAAASGVALIFVDRHGQNSIAVAGGANAQLLPQHIRRAKQDIVRAQMVLAQLETPLDTITAAAELAFRAGIPFMLNPAPARKLPRALLRRVSILTPNEVEAAYLTGIEINNLQSAGVAARRLLSLGVRRVVMTLGSRGALIADAEGIRQAPGFRVKAVDTIGAGDTFNGALAVSLAGGESIEAAVHYANAAAALSVTRRGAQASAPERREILAPQRKRHRS